MKQIYLALLIVLSGCATTTTTQDDTLTPSEEVYYLSNIGTICVEKVAQDRLKFTYIPLNKICANSNIGFRDSTIYVTPAGAEYKLDTYSKFVKFKNRDLLDGCWEAGIKDKEAIIRGVGPISIFLGNKMLGEFSNRVGDVSCYTKTKAKIYKNDDFIKEYKRLKNIKYTHLYI